MTTTTIAFTRPTPSEDGRTLHSTTTVVEREDGSRIELDISTSHWKGRGYRATATRQHADGYTRRMSLSFGADSDTRTLPAIDGAPAPTARFNRNVLADLHTRVVEEISEASAEWTSWAADCAAVRD
ncbi:hypothetical protein ACIGCK_14460 [Microbacterium sp. NPDC078428]|uniref:hypothetical protein n=1 Tax=Microbacterium sp. NPDC078428 TaxID=3364190 RepID=UPI0037CB8A34